MKVIGQLIAYFQARGALSEEQLEYLSKHGFRVAGRDDGQDDADDTILEDQYPAVELLEPEPHEELLGTALKRRHGRGNVQHKGRAVEDGEIAEWLTERFDEWQGAFAGLQQVVAPLAEVDSWRRAATLVRQVDDTALIAAFARGLAEQTISFAALWETLGFDRCHELANRPGLRGPAISAFRALLAATDLRQVTKHQWLLKQSAVADLFNLLCAQRRLARAFGHLFETDPPAVSAAIRREPHPLAFWTVLLLYNAVRRDSPHENLAHREYGPLVWHSLDEDIGVVPTLTWGREGAACEIENAVWRQAWSLAMVMNPARVTPYFATEIQRDDPTELYCPAGWRPR